MARLATLAWIGLLCYLAWLPRLPQVPTTSESTLSMVAHFATHFGLAGLVYLAAGIKPVGLLERLRLTAIAFGFSSTLGLGLEGLQWFLPQRSAQASDAFLDVAGAIAGAATAFTLAYLKVNQTLLSVSAFGITLILILMAGIGGTISIPSVPRVGDHWHASYQISICGSVLPPLPGTPGFVHTHGDGAIHIHPRRDREAGANATLALFFATSGGKLADDSMTLPSDKTYANGDNCPEGQPGAVVVTVNGTKLERPSSYVPRNRDQISIAFQSGEKHSR